MVIPQPMSLVQQSEPFDDWDWIYEIKHDGFRALAVIEDGQCRFSRKKHKLTGHQDLEQAILDGELLGERSLRSSSADVSSGSWQVHLLVVYTRKAYDIMV